MALVLAICSATAFAAPTTLEARAEAPTASPVDADLFQVRLRYAVAIRSGVENDAGPGLLYSGVTPNDFALQAWGFPLVNRMLGFVAGVQREGFSLIDSNGTRLTQGSLLRANVGVGARVRLFERLGLDGSVSYGFAQSPLFGTLLPAFTPISRHALLLAARTVFDLGPVTLEARFEYPIAFATNQTGLASTGLGVGGGLRVRLFRVGALDWGAQADVTWNSDALKSATTTASQSVVRAGLALDLQWRELNVLSLPPGQLQVKTTLDGAPTALSVTLETAAGPKTLTTGEDGTSTLELPAGAVSASAVKPGFVDGRAQGTIESRGALTLELNLTKVVPKSGALKVRVVSRDAAVPLADVKVTVNDQALDVVDGVASFPELPGGPASVKVTATGFNDGDEAANVVLGSTTELEVSLVPLKKRVPALVRGLVRSARNGTPVRARLTLVELKQVIDADANGAFQVEVPGGKHTIVITGPSYLQQRKTIVVRDGDQTILNVDLSPQQ